MKRSPVARAQRSPRYGAFLAISLLFLVVSPIAPMISGYCVELAFDLVLVIGAHAVAGCVIKAARRPRNAWRSFPREGIKAGHAH